MGDPVSIVVSPIINELISFATSLIKDAIVSAGQVKNDIVTLSTKFGEMVAVVAEAERRQSKSKPLTLWLEELKDVCDDAEDLLYIASTEASLQKQKRQVLDMPFHPHKVSFKLRIASELKQILARLDKVLEKQKFHLTPAGSALPGVEEITAEHANPFLHTSETLGRSNEKEEIVHRLISDGFNREGCIPVIPIVGMGGIGKTTLAKLVYNDQRVQSHFEYKIWVGVTVNFSLEKILDGMIATFSDKNYQPSTNNVPLELQKLLKNKCFLLVLDNVWSEEYKHWKSIETIIGVGQMSSRVIVTSRSRNAFGCPETKLMYPLQELCDEECWSLFCRNASPVSPRQLDIGSKIVGKCRGLPLAVEAIGRLLRNLDDKAWEDILGDDIWQADERRQAGQPQILPALKLSFDHLPPHLKECFAYCSIFPKAHVFDKNELVKVWVAQGFTNAGAGEVQGTGREEKKEDKGLRYFNQLLARSFFRDEGSERFKMHDLIHDLAQTVSGPRCCQVRGDNELSHLSIKTRHVSLICEDVKQPVRKMMEECPKIRTILSPADYSYDFGQEVLDRMFRTLRYIRVLDLSSSTLAHLPKSIKELKLLHYLDLSKTDISKLPNAICSLLNLQTLKLLGCVFLFELPKDFSNLIHLRHLELDELFWYKCTRLPPRMGCLTSLHNLHTFPIYSQEGHEIDELKNMIYLTGTLRISKLENSVNSGVASLKDKKGLQKLVLEWSDGDAGLQHAQEAGERVLEDLRPHMALKELKICCYRGTQFPTWMKDGLLQNLKVLSLYYCTGCKLLTLGQLPELEELYIKGMRDLEVWQEEQCPSLFRLKISNCSKLRELPPFFPQVRVLKIKKCDSLKTLPAAPALMFLILAENLVLEGWHQPAQFTVHTRVNSDNELMLCIHEIDHQSSISENDQIQPVASLPEGDDQHRTTPCTSENDQNQSGANISEGDDQLQLMLSPSNNRDRLIESAFMSVIPNLMLELLELTILDCPRLQSLPHIFYPQKLVISGCESLRGLPPQEQTQRLTNLSVRSCHDSKLVDAIPHSRSLLSLVISNISTLVSLPRWPDLPELLHLYIHGCQDLVSLFQEEGWWRSMPKLITISISNCSNLQELPGEGLPTTLECLAIRSCPSLQSLGPPWVLKTLTSLKDICIRDCPKLESFPKEGLPFSLQHLRIDGCPQLAERCGKEDGGGPDWPNIMHIPDLQIQTLHRHPQPSSSVLRQHFGCFTGI